MQCSVRGKRDLQTITGKASAASVGEIIKAQGEWSLHHSHGMQFVASQIQTFPRWNNFYFQIKGWKGFEKKKF